MKRKRVIVAAMDWGLGHATRCIPVVRTLLGYECDVTLAGSGFSLQVLGDEFPNLKQLELPGYNPLYPADGSMAAAMLQQLPRLLSVIREEHRVIKRFHATIPQDLIISDNRFGCYVDETPSVFLTHQLTIQMPRGWQWLSGIVNRFNSSKIRKFSKCWIPDYPDSLFTGAMTKGYSDPCTFIGPLSRFHKADQQAYQYDFAAILSGPEPQRSLLENILLPHLSTSCKRGILVRGIRGTVKKEFGNLEVVDFMDTHQLEATISNARVIIARSGYSSIMDLSRLNKHCILIPTPGQTEQEYLAGRLMQQGMAYAVDQDTFDLQKALTESEKYKGLGIQMEFSKLPSELESLLKFRDEEKPLAHTLQSRYS